MQAVTTIAIGRAADSGPIPFMTISGMSQRPNMSHRRDSFESVQNVTTGRVDLVKAGAGILKALDTRPTRRIGRR